MPFQDTEPKKLTPKCVASVPDHDFGIYVIEAPGAYVFIGSGNIKRELERHLTDDAAGIWVHAKPELFWRADHVTPSEEAVAALIEELSPVCNQRVG